MPKKSKLKLSPVSFGNETLGERLARIRKERGLTQKDIADRTGLTQVLVSDYERDRLRLTAEMAVRFVEAMGIGTEELLRSKKKAAPPEDQPSPKLLRRMKQIETLPVYEQRALLTTIDKFLAAAQDNR
jgi:transcriptional regulator with XRE-family HTH domain